MAKLAVIFPGIGYTCDKPLLYYGGKLAEQAGYERKLVSYVYDGDKKIRGNSKKMEAAFRSLYAQAEETLADVSFGRYDEVLFLSKSVGTVIAAAYAKKLREQESFPDGLKQGKLRHVLYTPLEYTFKYDPTNAIAFLGTADPWCVPQEVLRLASERSIPAYVYEGLNHSLESEEVLGNLEILKDVMGKTAKFVHEI